ncbi:MAG: hypothetical protein P9L97_05960 [Candidatus Tenebribacter davisii]|nr:hypothetical protein [Candidatus Tenebribacter davisii]
MSDNREAGLVEIYDRIKANRVVLGLNSFKRTPTVPVKESDLTCVLMIEGEDMIIKKSSRGTTGYPATRLLTVTIEVIAEKTIDVKQITRDLRGVIFTDRVTGNPSSIVADNVFIHENRMEGPMGFGLPGIIGMRLILDLIYTDNGL